MGGSSQDWWGGEHSYSTAASSAVMLSPPRCWEYCPGFNGMCPQGAGWLDTGWCLGVLTICGPSALAERSVALTSLRPAKAEGPSRLRRHPRMRLDPAEPTDTPISSSSSSQSSTSCLPHLPRKRFQMYSKSPFYRAGGHGESPETQASPEGLTGPLHYAEDRPQFTTRGTFNPEKGKQKLKSVKSSPAKTKEPPDGGPGGGRKRNPEADCAAAQPLVLMGSNEFMV